MTRFVGCISRGIFRRQSYKRYAIFSASTVLLGILALSWGAYRRSHAVSARSLNSPGLQEGSRQDLSAQVFQHTVSPAFHVVPERIVYPYSVVPGGVLGPQELQEASLRDSVVANHYEKFSFRKARVVELKQPRLVYLSYRIADKVFWTKKKVALRKGEKLITDGVITARARCANQVSELPHNNTSTQEPLTEKLEDPVVIIPLPPDFPSVLMMSPGITGLGPSDPSGSSSLPFSRAGLIYGPSFGGGSVPGGVLPKDPIHPPTSVPEPGTVVLICAALTGMGFGFWKEAAKNSR